MYVCMTNIYAQITYTYEHSNTHTRTATPAIAASKSERDHSPSPESDIENSSECTDRQTRKHFHAIFPSADEGSHMRVTSV